MFCVVLGYSRVCQAAHRIVSERSMGYTDKASLTADREVGVMGQRDHVDWCPDASVTLEIEAQTHEFTFFQPKRSGKQRERSGKQWETIYNRLAAI